MPLIAYRPQKFATETTKLLDAANKIIREYQEQEFVLTLRQLYYQFVSRDLIENNLKSYKRLGDLINNGRLAGKVDWSAIEDRTRNVKCVTSWASPASIIQACAASYRIDLWSGQKYRPEVWIEKEALAGVFEGVCAELRLPMFCCRGYTSQSEMWASGQRLKMIVEGGQTPFILHFGDHDPSGMDMTRDTIARMKMFMGGCRLDRLALNMDQVEKYNPPPNPAKTTDSRYRDYIREFGEQSWELDALEPSVLADLVRDRVAELTESVPWSLKIRLETEQRGLLLNLTKDWEYHVRQIEKRARGKSE